MILNQSPRPRSAATSANHPPEWGRRWSRGDPMARALTSRIDTLAMINGSWPTSSGPDNDGRRNLAGHRHLC